MKQATDQPALEDLLESENEDLAAFERLESRILEMVEQLRAARRAQAEAEKVAAHGKKLLAEKDKLIAELEERQAGAVSDRGAVKRRIEGLLERIESLEE